jgi:hypothetical protein
MLSEVSTVTCPKCNSDSCTTMPAEIRIYRNAPRTQSHPPVSPSPDIHVCMECGWSEFVIPSTWISAWLKPQPRRSEPQPLAKPMRPIPVAALSA